jgi:glutathione S-transferase
MTLIEKNVAFQEVEVDFIKGEQGCEAFRKINPNMKVPALTIQNAEVRWIASQH